MRPASAPGPAGDGDQWIINGTKLYITNGTQADWLCLLCRTSDEGGYRGMSQIIVPTATDGVAVSRKLEKMGMWSSDTAELSFSDVRVPVSNTIGEVGSRLPAADGPVPGRAVDHGVQAGQGSIAQALQRTKAYLLAQRQAFGRPPHGQPAPAVLCWPNSLSARHDMLGHYARASADVVRRGEDRHPLRHHPASPWKPAVLQREVADTCVQFHGGIAYMDDHWASRFYRDTRLDSIGAGADEVMLRILARMDGYATE